MHEMFKDIIVSLLSSHSMLINISFFYYVGDEKLSFTGDYIYKFKQVDITWFRFVFLFLTSMKHLLFMLSKIFILRSEFFYVKGKKRRPICLPPSLLSDNKSVKLMHFLKMSRSWQSFIYCHSLVAWGWCWAWH